MIPNIQMLPMTSADMRTRKSRKPQHTWHTKQRPWQIQPVCIAPVIPGETLTNMLWKTRAVTKPIKNPLIGWWSEHYWFYVKHRQLAGSTDFQDMMLEYNKDMSAQHSAAVTEHYHEASSINWTDQCLKIVTEKWFRDEGEAWDTVKIGNLPVASVSRQNWMDSLVDTTLMPDGGDLDVPNTDATTAEGLSAQMQMYEFMRGMGYANMSYEDWLKTYGISVQRAEEPTKPELIRYSRDWQYPSNTVDPATGTPTSAVSWAISERADKRRLCKEPGFIFGVQIYRPKVYFGKQTSHLVDRLDDAFAWLPALMRDDYTTSLREFAADAAPLTANTTNGFWVDLRDLFIYGDQFINHAVTDTDYNAVALPTVALQHKYASATDADAMFASASPANTIETDGVCDLNFASHQQDMT